jgi:hypothetical protein
MELAVSFGLARRERADRIVVEWPSGLVRKFLFRIYREQVEFPGLRATM